MLRANTLILLGVLSVSCSKVHETVVVPGTTDSEVSPDAGILPIDSTVQDSLVPSDGGLLDPDATPLVQDGAVDGQVDARVLVDVCDNPEDQAGLVELGTDIAALLQEQGIPCFLQSMGGPRFAMCVAEALGDTLTPDCALCVGEQADCVVSRCLTSCIADQGGEGCIACVCEAGCVDAFAVCSGVDFGLFACPDA